MKKNILFITSLLCLIFSTCFAQKKDTIPKECFVGSSLFMLMNLVNDPEPPKFHQLNLGYRITKKDVISVELITWNYYEPLGVPINQKKTAQNYPGKVSAVGAGLAYQRFLWKQAYAQIHSTIFKQNYISETAQKIGSGLQLFNTLRAGYQFQFFKNTFFIEPSVAFTFWPINTNLPDSFKVEENKWNSFFTPEPGLNFGFNF